jgi:GNAT superfamily N-acetyltransferase
MDGALVRAAQLSDLAALVDLRTEMFRAMGTSSVHEQWETEAARWLAAQLVDPGSCIYVVEIEGRVVSCALGTLSESQPSPTRPSGRDLYISNVSTLPAFRGRGYAGAVFAEVLDWGRRQPPPVRARLFATGDGRGLYERAGFTESTWPVLGVDLN